MATRAVLFDFDGVLADTENVHVAAWERTFERIGLDVPPNVCARAAEIDDRQFLREVLDQRQIEHGAIEGWSRLKQAMTKQMLRDSPRLYPGVAELVNRLFGHVRLGVVSGTWRENVATVLDAAGLANAFELLIGKEDVTALKPAPDAYGAALARMKLEPGAVVALEDSPTGLAAAQAARVRAVAVGHRRGPGEWVGSAAFLPDLRDNDRAVSVLMGE